MPDLIIRGAQLIDGSGADARSADIAVDGDRISAIGDLGGQTAACEIDAAGLTVTPGFIDTHAHSDGILLHEPQHASGLLQGVTTEIITQDGLSYAPLSAENLASYGRYLAGLLGPPPTDLDMSSIAAMREHYQDKGCNVAVLAPHGPIRLSSVGFRDVPLVGDALAEAQRLIAESIEQGALGFSTGLSYYPNSYSDTEELVALNQTVAAHGGVYVVHVRNHNDDRAPGGTGITEALEIGRRTGVPVHVSHYRTHPNNAGRVAELMAEIDEAKGDGVDVTLETYPYAAAATVPGYFLAGEFHEGGVDALLERLADAELRPRLLESMRTLFPGALEGSAWTWINHPNLRRFEGVAMAEAAASQSLSVEEHVLEVMLESGLACGFCYLPPASVTVTRQIEADVMALLRRPDYTVGSDGIPFTDGMPHPRAYGTFPRILGRLRRRHTTIPFEHLVRGMTGLSAERFKITDRGLLREGAFADIAVFNADTLIDGASFEDPKAPPAGMEYVIVNGQIAVERGKVTGALAGRAVP